MDPSGFASTLVSTVVATISGLLPPRLLVEAGVFVAVMLLIVGLAILLFARRTPDRITASEAVLRDASPTLRGQGDGRQWLGERLARHLLEGDEKRRSAMRQRLIRAGYYDAAAVNRFYGVRVLLGVAMPAVFLLAFPAVTDGMDPATTLWTATLLLALGYYAPLLLLNLQIQARTETIRRGFPDALDLMVVCAEAGMSLDASINRLGEELSTRHPVLAEQFQLIGLELRAGRSREDSLRNFAERSGVDEISAFAVLLIQSEQLGTSIADAIRVYADDMRTRRLLKAEERAQQLPVKLAFPLVLFMFPCFVTVIMLPVAIRIVRLMLNEGS